MRCATSSSSDRTCSRVGSGVRMSIEAMTMPSRAMRLRSASASSASVPEALPPSLYIVSRFTSPSMAGMLAERENSRPLRRWPTPSICPFPMTAVWLMPTPRASCSCSFRKAYSPCTGRNCCGRTSLITSSCSSRYAWPLEWRHSPRPITISGPRVAIWFIIFMTRFSFPGMLFALYRIKSLSESLRKRAPPYAARLSEALGSPCEPVVTTRSSSGL
mmetsp:Transcript_19779/g.64298  ORF Transcript_19779/g.64298 Transcript_19779/m.64298 type:complete len:217 (-) Transcript_19779:972-1622(-)